MITKPLQSLGIVHTNQDIIVAHLPCSPPGACLLLPACGTPKGTRPSRPPASAPSRAWPGGRGRGTRGRLEPDTRTHEGTVHSHFSPAASRVASSVTFFQAGKEVQAISSQPPQRPSNRAHYIKSNMAGTVRIATRARQIHADHLKGHTEYKTHLVDL